MSRLKRLLTACLIAVTLIGLDLGLTVAQDQNYEGEHFCRWAPAWPNGTYLGQMHPYHSSFYTGYAERRGWDPCTTWALDQRNSAIRGLRELGYTVVAPAGGAPDPVPPPGPVQEQRIDPDLQVIWDEYAARLREFAARSRTEGNTQAAQFFESMISGNAAQTVRITLADLPSTLNGRYIPSTHTIEMNRELLHERISAAAAILTHEMVHATAVPTTNVDECYEWERVAFTAQAAVWILTDYPSADTPLERWLTRLVDIINTDEFNTWLDDAYAHQCDAWQASQLMLPVLPESR